MLEQEVKAYFAHLGVDYRQLKEQSPATAAEQHQRTIVLNSTYHQRLAEAIVLACDPSSFSRLERFAQLDTAADATFVGYRKETDKVMGEFHVDHRRRWRALTEKTVQYTGANHIRLKRDVFYPGSHFFETVVPVHGMANLAQDMIVYGATNELRDFYQKNHVRSGVEEIDFQKSLDWFYMDLAVGGVSYADFLKQDFSAKKQVFHPDLVKYLQLVRGLDQLTYKVDANIIGTNFEEMPDMDSMDDLDAAFSSRDIPQAGYKDNVRDFITKTHRTMSPFDPKLSPKALQQAGEILNINFDKRDKRDVILRRMTDIYEHVGRFQQQLQTALFSDAPIGEEVRAVLFNYFRSNADNRIIDLITRSDGLVSMYRRTRVMEASQADPFYSFLAERLAERIEDLRQIVMPEDLQLISRPHKEVSAEPNLRTAFDHLTGIAGWRRITPDQTDVNWETTGFHQPTSLSLELGQLPYQATVTLTYQTDDEVITFTYQVNAKKDTVDWNALEDPNSEEETKKQCQLLLKQVLDSAAVKAREALQQRVQVVQTPPPAAQKKSTVRPTPYRELIEAQGTKVQPTVEVLDESAVMSETGQVKQMLFIPSGEELDRLLARIPNKKIRQQIINRMKRFNSDGLGTLSPLKNPFPSGDKAYGLRSGGYRILSEPANFSDKLQIFRPVIVEDRRIAYDAVDN